MNRKKIFCLFGILLFFQCFVGASIMQICIEQPRALSLALLHKRAVKTFYSLVQYRIYYQAFLVREFSARSGRRLPPRPNKKKKRFNDSLNAIRQFVSTPEEALFFIYAGVVDIVPDLFLLGIDLLERYLVSGAPMPVLTHWMRLLLGVDTVHDLKEYLRTGLDLAIILHKYPLSEHRWLLKKRYWVHTLREYNELLELFFCYAQTPHGKVMFGPYFGLDVVTELSKVPKFVYCDLAIRSAQESGLFVMQRQDGTSPLQNFLAHCFDKHFIKEMAPTIGYAGFSRFCGQPKEPLFWNMCRNVFGFLHIQENLCWLADKGICLSRWFDESQSSGYHVLLREQIISPSSPGEFRLMGLFRKDCPCRAVAERRDFAGGSLIDYLDNQNLYQARAFLQQSWKSSPSR